MSDVLSSGRIELIKGDITKIPVDAIVNAANNGLLGGGGVDGAIHRAGGPAIMDECRQYTSRHGRLPTGEAVVTTAGNLPARYVIHTVGPVWFNGQKGEPGLLADAYRNSLKASVKKGCASVAFPNISTGVYGYPKQEAAQIAVREVAAFLEQHAELAKVLFVCYDDDNYRIYSEIMKRIRFIGLI